MNIYSLNKKEIWKAIKSFNKCEYGKIQFVLSYSVFFIFFLFMIVFFIFDLLESKSLIPFAFIFAINTLIVFILGSMHYYKELRFFVYKLDKKDL